MKIDGLPVVDGKKKVKIVITRTDVRNGGLKNPSSCAAALACVRQVSGCTAARVHLGRTFVKIGKKWLRYQTPKSLRTEIIAFDRGGTFEAGIYQLTVLPPSMQETRGKRAGSKPKWKRGRPGKHRAKYHLIHDVRGNGHYEATPGR